ncbi:RNA-directed DNA polymerase [Myxococcus virescens]|nr:RNA-directed DNA polymerase [Myxococcus virescens]
MRKSRLSLSRPVPSTVRALETKVPFSQLMEEKARCRRQGRYVLQADVSQFYRSIYTHSIPWALHGKVLSKKLPVDKSLPGNILDELVRCGQDRQSVGIPIGPDTSLVLAELLMTSIDASMETTIQHTGGFRFVDDWEMSFARLASAEQGLAQLQQFLGEWELTLNPKKTRILELPLPLEALWAVELSRFRIEKGRRRGRTSLLQYFDLVFRHASAHPDESVIKYALGRLKKREVHVENWDLLESLLFQAANAEPGVLNFVLEIVEIYAREGCTLDTKGLGKLLSDQVTLHGPRVHGSEVLWALWGALRFGLELDANAAAAVLSVQDSFVAILALDLIRRGRLTAPSNSPWWEEVMTPEALSGPHWLLSYEAGMKKLLPGGKAHIVKNPHFKFLKTAAVEFYLPVPEFTPTAAIEQAPVASDGSNSGNSLADYFG